MALDDDCKIFSHGDFHLYNVLVDESLKVTGIVDWQAAGFSINEWDYLEARLWQKSSLKSHKFITRLLTRLNRYSLCIAAYELVDLYFTLNLTGCSHKSGFLVSSHQ